MPKGLFFFFLLFLSPFFVTELRLSFSLHLMSPGIAMVHVPFGSPFSLFPSSFTFRRCRSCNTSFPLSRITSACGSSDGNQLYYLPLIGLSGTYLFVPLFLPSPFSCGRFGDDDGNCSYIELGPFPFPLLQCPDSPLPPPVLKKEKILFFLLSFVFFFSFPPHESIGLLFLLFSSPSAI